MTARSQDRLRHGCLRLGLAGALLALAACSGDTNLVRDAAVATGIGAEPKPAPDFVASSRPAELDYIRPGVATRPTLSKNASQIQAFEAQMEAARVANESQAAAVRDLGAAPASSPAARPNP